VTSTPKPRQRVDGGCRPVQRSLPRVLLLLLLLLLLVLVLLMLRRFLCRQIECRECS
jgi:hypothetical protein